LVLSTFWGSLTEVEQKGKAMNAVSSEGAFIMNRITQIIRNADSIVSPGPANSATSLTLMYEDSGLDPSVFDLNSGNIRLSQGATPFANLNSSQVSITTLTFTNLTGPNAKGVIRVQLGLSFNNPDGRATYNHSQTFYATATIK
jgi:hypothetical protein